MQNILYWQSQSCLSVCIINWCHYIWLKVVISVSSSYKFNNFWSDLPSLSFSLFSQSSLYRIWRACTTVYWYLLFVILSLYESIVHVKLSIYLGIIIYFVWYTFLSIDTPPYTWKLQNIGYEACHYGDVLIGAMASQMNRLTIVYSIFFPGADQRKHQCSTSLAFVRGIHRWSVNSPHKGLLTRKMFPFDDVIMVRSIKSHYQAVALGGFIYLPQSWAIILTALDQTWATIQKIFRNKLTLRLQGRITIKQDIFL